MVGMRREAALGPIDFAILVERDLAYTYKDGDAGRGDSEDLIGYIHQFSG